MPNQQAAMWLLTLAHFYGLVDFAVDPLLPADRQQMAALRSWVDGHADLRLLRFVVEQGWTDGQVAAALALPLTFEEAVRMSQDEVEGLAVLAAFRGLPGQQHERLVPA